MTCIRLPSDTLLAPLTVEEVSRLAENTPFPLPFQIDPNLPSPKIVPLPRQFKPVRHETLYKQEELTVYYPAEPQVPHHLAIAFPRKIKGLADLTEEENAALFRLIDRIAAVYHSIGIKGFVTNLYDTPQAGHEEHFVVELLPHLPGFEGEKNVPDKMKSYQYGIFREAPLPTANYPFSIEEQQQESAFWKKALPLPRPPLTEQQTAVVFPYVRYDSYQTEANEILYHQSLAALKNRGASILDEKPFEAILPLTPEAEKAVPITIKECAFCKQSVIDYQHVVTFGTATILYNYRRGPEPGLNFLILPSRHTEQLHGLTETERHDIWVLRQLLTEVLKEKFPAYQIMEYIQNGDMVGQTVFHTHEQFIVIDPKTVDLTWVLMNRLPFGNVSAEEMRSVCTEMKEKIEALLEAKGLAKSA